MANATDDKRYKQRERNKNALVAHILQEIANHAKADRPTGYLERELERVSPEDFRAWNENRNQRAGGNAEPSGEEVIGGGDASDESGPSES